jgi:hypothetical protein
LFLPGAIHDFFWNGAGVNLHRLARFDACFLRDPAHKTMVGEEGKEAVLFGRKNQKTFMTPASAPG